MTIAINKKKIPILMVALFAIFFMSNPALADPFEDAGKTITGITNEAVKVAQNVLLSAAVLSLIIGLAPMLWGQIKVKWIISSLVACVLFGLCTDIVGAFAKA